MKTLMQFFRLAKNTNFTLASRLFLYSLFDWRMIPREVNASILVVANDADRPLMIQNKSYSPNADLIAFVSGLTVVSVARLLDRKSGDRALLPVYPLTGAFSRALIQKNIRKLLNNILKKSNCYPFSSNEYNLWCEILDSINPKSVLAIMPSRELCQATHDRNINCYEIQHGVIYDLHPWYSESRKSEPVSWLPSAYVLWHMHSWASISRLYQGRHLPSVYVVGSIFNASLKKSPVLSKLVETEFTSLHSRLSAYFDKSILLVTLSWGMSDLDAPMISDAYIDAINSSSEKYFWIIRLHPAQIAGHKKYELNDFMSNYLPRFPASCYDEIYNSCPLPVLAKSVMLHVTDLSSSVIDLAFNGVKSIVTFPGIEDQHIYPDSISKNNVTYLPGPSAEKLLDTIDKFVVDAYSLSDCTQSLESSEEDFNSLIRDLLAASVA